MPSGLEQFFNSSGGQGLLAALGGIAGGFPSTSSINGSGSSTTNNQGETNTSASSNASSSLENLLRTILSSTSAGTATTTPNLSPQAQSLINSLTQAYGAATKPVNLTGYQAGGIQGINANSDIARQSADAIMASRGLANSPVAATTSQGIDQNRINQITQFNQGLPLLQHQLNLQNLGAASQFASSIPYGTTTTQQQQQQQTGQQQQNQNTQNYGYQEAYGSTKSSQHTDQAQQQQQKQGGGIGGVVGGLAATLASLFSDEQLKEEIKPIVPTKAVDKLMQLKPSTWKWKGSEVEDAGVLAQDIARVMPNLVEKDPEGSGFLKVNYAGLIGELVGALQAVNLKVEGVV